MHATRAGELDSDLNLCLKATSSEQGVKVSKSALNELSGPLGSMAGSAIDSGSNVLIVEDLSQQQLSHLAAAMYGNTLKAACSVADILALSQFAHKYNIPSMETALIGLLAIENQGTSQMEDLMQLYQSVHQTFSLLQDHLLACILKRYKLVGDWVITLTSIILPRHLNTWLAHLCVSPARLYQVLWCIVNNVTMICWHTSFVSMYMALEACVFAGRNFGKYFGCACTNTHCHSVCWYVITEPPSVLFPHSHDIHAAAGYMKDTDWEQLRNAASTAVQKLYQRKDQGKSASDSNFYVGLSDWINTVKRERRITELQEFVKTQDSSLIDARKLLRDKEMVIQRLTAELLQHPKKHAKRSR